MNKQILTDARWIGKHGIGRYTTEILRRLPELRAVKVPGKPLNPLDPFLLSLALKREESNLFYNPGFNAPIAWNGISILTVHDLIHLDDPSQASPLKRQYYNHVIRPQVLKAPFVFTVSDFSKNRIQEWLSIDSDRILVAPNGVSEDFANCIHAPEKKDYFVFVGTSRSHKNTTRMLQSFAQMDNKNTTLKWIGQVSADDQNLIVDLQLSGRIEILTDLSDANLATIYANAKGTILVSTIEGFGLPPLESALCGTWSLISNCNPMKNELHKVSIVCDPYSVDSITEGLNSIEKKAIFSAPEFEAVEALKKKFNWDNTALFIKKSLKGINS